MSYWTIPRLWEGATAVVMASGQSLRQEDADAVRHLPRVVTNATYIRAPDAEIIFAADAKFWHCKDYQDVFACPGYKVSVDSGVGVHPNTPDGVLVLMNSGKQGFDGRRTHIRTGGNSGYAAIHIAATAGAKRVLLLGLDMTGGHWHGKHPEELKDPSEAAFTRWTKHFQTLAQELTRRGIEVLNCSPISRLTCFPKKALRDCL